MVMLICPLLMFKLNLDYLIETIFFCYNYVAPASQYAAYVAEPSFLNMPQKKEPILCVTLSYEIWCQYNPTFEKRLSLCESSKLQSPLNMYTGANGLKETRDREWCSPPFYVSQPLSQGWKIEEWVFFLVKSNTAYFDMTLKICLILCSVFVDVCYSIL